MGVRNVLRVFNEVFSKKKYVFICFLIVILFYLLNVIIINYFTLISITKNLDLLVLVKTLIILSISVNSLITQFSFVTLIIISLLLGIMVSLLIYRVYVFTKLKGKKKKHGIFPIIGALLGIIVPGCAACGLGLAPLLGISSALLILPFDGKEISILAIIILCISIIKVSDELFECKIIKKKR